MERTKVIIVQNECGGHDYYVDGNCEAWTEQVPEDGQWYAVFGDWEYEVSGLPEATETIEDILETKYGDCEYV